VKRSPSLLGFAGSSASDFDNHVEMTEKLCDQVCPNPDPMSKDKGLVPKSFAGHPLFASGGPSKDDVFQGSDGDCYFMATLAAAADANSDFIKRTVFGLDDGTYVVRLFRANGAKTFVRITAELWVDDSGRPKYAKLGREESLWVPLVEKAFAISRSNQNSYDSIAGGSRKALNHVVWGYSYIKIDDTGIDLDDLVRFLLCGVCRHCGCHGITSN
jgi:hypothetical protein